MAKFFTDNDYKKVKQLRKDSKLDQAERMLLDADPSPAIADELRKTQSEKARLAKKDGQWKKVIQYLEFYNTYAKKITPYCMKTVNQKPPSHTPADLKLLEEAKHKSNVL
jgi:hypothetical protein